MRAHKPQAVSDGLNFHSLEEKETFCRQMGQELRAIPEGERVIVGGYINGYVGFSRETIERVHGG